MSPFAGTSGPARAGARPAAGPAPRPRPGTRSAPRSPLAVVPEKQSSQGRAFVLLLIGVLGAGLVGLLVLNTAMQRAAFALDSLDRQAQALEVRRQVLDLRVDRLRSPQTLGLRATELGMVSMTEPVFLRLSDGEILGSPQAAVAGIGPQLVPLPVDESQRPGATRNNRQPRPDQQETGRQQGTGREQGTGRQQGTGQQGER